MEDTLRLLLIAAAIGQLLIAGLNLNLVRLLAWDSDLERMPLLLREVFHVHKWFVSVTLLLFAVLTLRFSAEMAAAASPLSAWLAAGIAGFWAFRTVLQVTYYSGSHWHGKPGRTAIHCILLLSYGGCSLVYALAALRG